MRSIWALWVMAPCLCSCCCSGQCRTNRGIRRRSARSTGGSTSAGFTYKNSENPASSYYPHNSWNQYYFAGPDCSGYVGWSVYNVMNTQSGQADQPYYVGSSTTRAKTLG